MFRSALFHSQLLAFFAGFFLCAGVSTRIRHPSDTMWVSFSVLSIVFLLWSWRYAGKLKRRLPEIGNIKYSD